MAAFQTRTADWLSFEDALVRVQVVENPLPVTSRDPAAALGLALAGDVSSPATFPPGPTSHMDGYAVRFSDAAPASAATSETPRLAVPTGDARPGAPWSGVLPEGAAVRIMTGALLPDGADTVVPVEHTDGGRTSRGHVLVERRPRDVGQHVRPAGQEMERGDVLARAGDTVTPGAVALIAASTLSHVEVTAPPRVAVVVTGDELVPSGDRDAVEGGLFRVDILSPALPPFIEQAGAEALPPRRATDRTDDIREALEWAASSADLIVTTGGASMGEADLVKGVLDDMGFALDFWRVTMRPGSPFSFGRLPRPDGDGRVPVLGLPGNPTSAVVTFLALGIPAIRALGGHSRRFLPSVLATCGQELRGPEDLHCLLRVTLSEVSPAQWEARLAGDQGSGAIKSLALADGLAVLPEGIASVEAGEDVEVMLLPRAGWPRHR